MLCDPGKPISPRVLTGYVGAGENLPPNVKRLRGLPYFEQNKGTCDIDALLSPARSSARPASRQ